MSEARWEDRDRPENISWHTLRISVKLCRRLRLPLLTKYGTRPLTRRFWAS